jgi:hypothetical protein
MTPRQRRDQWTEIARRQFKLLRDWLDRRIRQPASRRVDRILERTFKRLPATRTLYRVGTALALLGWIAALAWPMTGLISAWTGAYHLQTTEFPLSHPKGAAADSQGRIFVVDAFHLRVQRYSPDGEFQRGWFVPRKTYAVQVTADDRVMVGAEGGARIYSTDGELLEIVPSELQRGENPVGAVEVRHGLLPRIADRESGRILIRRPWPQCLLASPFPAFVYFAIGLLFIGLGDWRSRRALACSSWPLRG